MRSDWVNSVLMLLPWILQKKVHTVYKYLRQRLPWILQKKYMCSNIQYTKIAVHLRLMVLIYNRQYSGVIGFTEKDTNAVMD